MEMPFSKTSHIEVIKTIANGMNKAGFNDNYLELGISKGKCFNEIAPLFKIATAVDNQNKSFDYISKNKNISWNYCNKVPLSLWKNKHNKCELVTLPFYYGVTIIRKINVKKYLHWM